MSKCNDDFFDAKKEWSRVKDTLLASYLPVYFAKVIHTKKPIVYIDCFAGAGKFADGEDGSPRIALAERKKALERTTSTDARIDMYFIDPVYADQLKTNIADYPEDDGHGKVTVINGTYESTVSKILSTIAGANVFLYVDPFGIKNLGNRIFAEVCKSFDGSVELLLNLNSFGFIREACRVTGAAYKGEKIELEERESGVPSKLSEATSLLTAIAGGDYWEKIIDDYRTDTDKSPAPSLKAERTFASIYRHTLSRSGGGSFAYVLDIPIRIKDGSYPKYRMVHATNHPDGCIEMADNMIKRAVELYRDVQSQGQGSLFDFDVNQEIRASESLIRDGLLKVIHQQSDALVEKIQRWGLKYAKSVENGTLPMRLHQIIATFFCTNGVVCSKKDVVDVLKKLESVGVIEVTRTPPNTPQNKPSKFWSEDKGKIVFVKVKGSRP